MEVVKSVVSFMCNSEFWRMAVLWSFSLIFSYLKLFYESLFSQESKFQPRCSLKDSIFSTALVARPVCIVTGATSGLGAAAAHALSNEGFYVVLVGRSSELLSKAISEIKSRNHDACLKAFEVNLSSFVSILEFKHSLQQWLQDSNMHSSVQLLINNAGILATSRRFTCEGYDDCRMLATNYIGAFCLTKVLLPLLESSPVPCRVVNVTSFTHRNVSFRQADRETISGKFFMKSKDYPYARIYEYTKCEHAISYMHTALLIRASPKSWPNEEISTSIYCRCGSWRRANEHHARNSFTCVNNGFCSNETLRRTSVLKNRRKRYC
ncbi:uncharacterized protein LOC131006673 isoform X6 [Salvia miltiorrhiza]|uniref:uncharacterized protein LOC131006673 isoform X6 n=1 Tax=Salvia miltiorrhiza TaxID=226208 RepID=UPI0025AC8ED5|nr:uncharacterized protein LOC131006673 isoform X6 [Salvia miltiorrhiza]